MRTKVITVLAAIVFIIATTFFITQNLLGVYIPTNPDSACFCQSDWCIAKIARQCGCEDGNVGFEMLNGFCDSGNCYVTYHVWCLCNPELGKRPTSTSAACLENCLKCR